MAKKKRKSKKPQEPIDDLTELETEILQNMLHTFREKALDLQTRRNYTQMEKDMIEKFYQNTLQKICVVRKKVFLKEGEMQEMEENHQLEIRMYLQKMKHLELEKSKNQEGVKKECDEAMQEEDKFHEGNINELKKVKIDLKTFYEKTDKKNENKVNIYESDENKFYQSRKEKYEIKLDDLELKYKDELEELKAKLELKLKVEIHEIEERKNLHINELMKNHSVAYNDLKSFYNEITAENLDLIKAQKEEIKKIHDRRANFAKNIKILKEKNQQLETPLRSAKAEMRWLVKDLKQYDKDKLSLANLKIKLVSLQDKFLKLTKEKKVIDESYEKCYKEKMDLLGRFDKIALEMKKNTEIQNFILDQKLEQRESELLIKEQKLQEIVATSGLDPHYVNQITEKMRETMEERTNEIKNLRYLIHHATKAYNDAIRVYEEKLIEFGIHPQELGFQPIKSITSTMPAGLVSS